MHSDCGPKSFVKFTWARVGMGRTVLSAHPPGSHTLNNNVIIRCLTGNITYLGVAGEDDLLDTVAGDSGLWSGEASTGEVSLFSFFSFSV